MDPLNIVSFDPYVIGFVKNNLVTMGLLLGLLKGLALLTPSTTDDKIVTLFTNLFTSLYKKGGTNDAKKT